MRSYRFFYHYRRSENKMTVHFRGRCMSVKDVNCLVPTSTKWNEGKQPFLVMQGFAKQVTVNKDVATIS